MVNMFAKILEPLKIIKIQNIQYSEKLILTDTVPANQSLLGKIAISSLGNFLCQFITGHFETLLFTVPNGGGHIEDDGISHLRGKMVDGSNQRQLFNDYVPLDLFLSPGRIKSNSSVNFLTDPPSNNLFYPQPFQYMFTVNSEILFDVKNDSNTPIKYELVFHGIRLPVASRERLKKEKRI